VIQSRNDPELGSQDLLTVANLFQGLGGVLGCIIAAFMMERYHPKNAFLMYGLYSLVVMVCCFFLSSEAELNYLVGEKEIITEWSSEIQDGETPS